jgi:hypothetical protein
MGVRQTSTIRLKGFSHRQPQKKRSDEPIGSPRRDGAHTGGET